MELGLPQPSINTRTALGKQANFSVNNTETAFTVSTPFAAGVGPFISGFVGKIKKKPNYQLKFRSSSDSDNIGCILVSSFFFGFRFPS